MGKNEFYLEYQEEARYEFKLMSIVEG